MSGKKDLKFKKKFAPTSKVLESVTKESSKDKKMEKEKAKAKAEKQRKKDSGSNKDQKVIKTKRKKKRRSDSYAYYIHKVLKTVHPNEGQSGSMTTCTLSCKSMGIIDCLAADLYDRISEEAVHLTRKQKKRTLSSKEVQTAARLVLPGDLAKHACGDGTRAVSNFQQRME